jgi:hypothetical protein
MRHYIYIATLLLWTTFSFGQTVQRQDGETAEQFATRFKPDSSVLTFKVVETKWNTYPIILAFYDQTYKLSDDQQPYHRIVATIYFQLSDYRYRKEPICTIDAEGGDPTIETAFFANANTGLATELIIVASWGQRHYDVNGTLYGTFVYEHSSANGRFNAKFLKDISEKLDGGCECSWSDGTSKKAKFKTEADIKAELKRRGYH